MTGPDGVLKEGQGGVIPLDQLGEQSLYPVEDVLLRRGVLCQGKGVHEELRGNLGDGWQCPQLVQLLYELQGEEASPPHANPTGVIIRLSRGFLDKVV